MSYNSKAFLADRERLLDPEPVRGAYRSSWHKSKWEQHATMPVMPKVQRTEEEWLEIENSYLHEHGIL